MPTDTPLLSREEILRRLRTIRFSSRRERLARRALSLNHVAVEAGLTREYLHMLASGKRRIGSGAQTAISRALNP